MPISITPAAVSAALRLGDSAEETAEAIRLLAFATEACSRHLGDAYAAAPEAVVNEAAIRLAAYLFDAPNAGRGLGFANAGRNSGAWTMLLPYRVHRAGSVGQDVAAAAQATGLTEARVLELIAAAGGGASSYRGAWSALDAAQRAALQIGDSVLHSARFWRAHVITTARVTEPGAASATQSDGWHAQPPSYRGVAPSSERHFDPLDVATDGSGDHFICLVEGAYNLSEVIAGPNWAALGGGGVALTTIEGLINTERQSTIAQVTGFLANYTLTTALAAVINPLIAVWARTGATSAVPSNNLPASEQAQRGAVAAGIADDIDESPGSRQSTALAWTATLLRRAVTRIVPSWARDTTTQIPADKLGNAPGAGGGLNEAAVDERIGALVKDFAEVADTTSIIPQGLYRPITVAASLPVPNAAIGAQFYGVGGSHADRVFWPKRIADQKTVTLRAAHLTEARGDLAVVGWQASPELGLVRPPWGVSLAVTRFAIEPSGAGWRVSMSGGSGLAHPVGIIVTGIGTATVTLFRRAGSPNDAPVYDSADSTATRQLVAGATYQIKIRYSGGQNFFNLHDSDYLEGLASVEDTFDLQAEIDRLGSTVASLAAAAGTTVTRHYITFDASTYAFADGASVLTASYPAGVTQASAEAALKTAYLFDDPQETPAPFAGPMTEYGARLLISYQATPTAPVAQLGFFAAVVNLTLRGIELANADERDGWQVHLTMVS